MKEDMQAKTAKKTKKLDKMEVFLEKSENFMDFMKTQITNLMSQS